MLTFFLIWLACGVVLTWIGLAAAPKQWAQLHFLARLLIFAVALPMLAVAAFAPMFARNRA